MSQPRPNTKCTVCGGSNFFSDAGFFFCSECNTQSQDIREEVYDDYFGTQKVTTRVLQKKTSSKELGETEKLTTWEVLNYVLKGVTEELITLGAKPFLKVVTLQLWASYLRKLEIAFTSVEIERKPKLGYAFKRRDASIIYGLTEKELREKSWRTRSRTNSAASSGSNTSDSDLNTSWSSTSGVSQSRRSILKKLTIRKKALASAEYTQLSQDITKSFSQNQTLEELDSTSETAETPKKLKVTKHARSLLNSSCTSSTEDEGRNLQKRLSKREVSSLRNVTMAKLVALVNVALAINKEDIQLSDFLRWVDEGHISLKAARKFLPEETNLDSQTQRMLEVDHLSYVKCQQLIIALCRELDIDQLPQPDFNQLTDRYCLELQLPSEVSEMTKKLLRLSQNSKVSKTAIHGSKYSEVQVMAAVLIIMKLIFSLDDCTEYSLSHAAAEMNRASRLNGDDVQQFVWLEWVQFIECRKAVVASCHLPTRVAVYGETVSRDTQLFLQHYSETAGYSCHRQANQRYALNKRWVEALTRCLQKLVTSDTECEAIKQMASLTPLHSCSQDLLSQHPGRVASVKHILNQDFTSYSLQYITDPDRSVAVGLTNNLNIILRQGAAASFEVRNFSKKPEDSIVIPRHGINKFNVKVKVVKNIKHRTVDKTNQLEVNQQNMLKEIISDDSDEENEETVVEESEGINNVVGPCCSDIALYKPYSQYWFCHTKLGKNDVTRDEFDVFSKKMFPSSFLWLLKECSRMIHVSPKDLYANVISLESKYKHILNGALFLQMKGKKKHS